MNSFTFLLIQLFLVWSATISEKVIFIYSVLSSVSEQAGSENASLKCEANFQYFINRHLCQGNEAYEMHAPPAVGVSRAHSDRARAQGRGTAEVIYHSPGQAWELPPPHRQAHTAPCRTIGGIVSLGCSVQRLETS